MPPATIRKPLRIFPRPKRHCTQSYKCESLSRAPSSRGAGSCCSQARDPTLLCNKPRMHCTSKPTPVRPHPTRRSRIRQGATTWVPSEEEVDRYAAWRRYIWTACHPWYLPICRTHAGHRQPGQIPRTESGEWI